MQEKVAERVSVYRAKKMMDCRESLLLEAGKIADSLLLAEAQAALRDSLARSRPNRPYKPAPLSPLDSGQVKPIFDKLR